MKSLRWNLRFLVETIAKILANEDDCIILIDGKRGRSKSTLAVKLALRLNRIRKQFIPKHKRFNMEKNIVYSRDDVIKFVNKWNTTAIADEMINVSYKRDFYQEEQKKLIKLLNMNRDHCNLLIMCIPEFSTIDADLKKITRIRLTCVRRGLAIIQTPMNSLYTADKWDQQNNERTERKWTAKGVTNPRYGRLTTYRGILKFKDLPPKLREKYKRIKNEKRNQLLLQESEENKLPSSEIDKFIILLKENKITEESLVNYCMIKGFKINQFKSKVNARLIDNGESKRVKDLIAKPKVLIKRNVYPGL